MNNKTSIEQQRKAELALLASIQEALLMQKEMPYIYEMVGESLHRMFEGHVVSIATFDHESGVEYFQYHFENNARAFPDPRPYNEIRKLLIETHTQLLVNENTESFVQNILGVDYISQTGIDIPKSFVFAPFVVDNEVRGYISLKHYTRETVFDAGDIELLNTLARSISVSMQNTRLLETEYRRANEQKALLDTMTDLSRNLELKTLLDAVLERAVALLGVTGGELAIYHEDSRTLESVASHNLGIHSGGIRLQHGEGAMGKVADTLQPLIIPDYLQWAERSGKYEKTNVRSVMVVPLMIGQRLVGALASVHHEENRPFTAADLKLLNMFAPLAATAIENARLFEAERRRADEQKALLDTMADLSRKLELTQLLNAVLERAVALLAVTGGELAIYHEDSRLLEVVASHNLGMNSGGVYLKHNEGAMGMVAETKQPLIIPDYQQWTGRSDKYSETIVHSVMVVPLLTGNQLVGALASVHHEKGRQFSNDDLRLLNMFAPLAATAIENARLFNKTNRLLEEAEQRTAELRITQSQLVHQEKLASLGELTAGIAHEIQNPLNFVNNFSDVSAELTEELVEELKAGHTEEAIALAADVIDNLHKITHHGKRADSIVKGMLQHSRSSTGIKESVDINALADEYLRLAYHGLRAKDKSFNASFLTDLDPEAGLVQIVPQEIGRVVLNLINNAFYAVSEKKTTAAAGYTPTVQLSTKRVNGKIELRVADNGNGIPAKIADKIFQPFFTTKPTGLGTGLGLSLSYDIITKGHSGELLVETTEGEGSTFIIRIPANAQAGINH
ncbi:MAG: GAF domain-containing protein [Chitinophagaceae bacterium]|nr:GAF domain-containing protein [Chitinophagaceae bacterium]